MIETNVTIGKQTKGFASIKTENDYYEFELQVIPETVIRFCKNNAVSVSNKAQQVSYYMTNEKVELVLRTLQAERVAGELLK